MSQAQREAKTARGKMMNASYLNEVANIINSTDKVVVISVAIRAAVDAGMDPQEAMDAVLGEGSWNRYAGMIYDKLNAA